MVRQLLFGGGISLINIGIHAAVVASVVLWVHRAAAITVTTRPVARLMGITASAAAGLMVGHTVEVGVWAMFYALADVAPAADPLYFAFVNYTTLGYGDVVPAEKWRLIGPITAMNGVMLFGLSVAVLFEVLRTGSRGIDRAGTLAD